jgi:hypothetical protein
VTNPPLAAMALLTAQGQTQEAPATPANALERRVYELEGRIVGLTRLMERFITRQDTTNEEIGEALDRVYRVLDNSDEGETE